jgi:hypothetical protein
MVVVPVYVLLPVRVSVPVPIFVNDPEPVICPVIVKPEVVFPKLEFVEDANVIIPV